MKLREIACVLEIIPAKLFSFGGGDLDTCYFFFHLFLLVGG